MCPALRSRFRLEPRLYCAGLLRRISLGCRRVRATSLALTRGARRSLQALARPRPRCWAFDLVDRPRSQSADIREAQQPPRDDPSQRNQVTLPARPAAPSPIRLNGMLMATTMGTARSVGSHRSRHSGAGETRPRARAGRAPRRSRTPPRGLRTARTCSHIRRPCPPQSTRRKPSGTWSLLGSPVRGRQDARASRVRVLATGQAPAIWL